MVKLNSHKIPIAAVMIAATAAAQQAADAMTIADVATAATAAVMIAATHEEAASHNGVSGSRVVSRLTNPPSIRSKKSFV